MATSMNSVGVVSASDVRNWRCYRVGCKLAFLLCLVGAILLVMLGFMIAKPAAYGLQFVTGDCVTIEEGTNAQDKDSRLDLRSCSCGKRCTSQFPCVFIYVQVLGLHDINQTRPSEGEEGEQPLAAHALLHADEDNLANGVCSTEYCSDDVYDNTEQVQKFYEKFGPVGMKFPCMYDPDDPSEVLVSRRYDKWTIVHCILWPTLVLIAGVVLSHMYCRKYHKLAKEMRQGNLVVILSAPAREQQEPQPPIQNLQPPQSPHMHESPPTPPPPYSTEPPKYSP